MYLFRLWLTFPLNGEKPSAIAGGSLVEVTSLIQTKVIYSGKMKLINEGVNKT